MLALIVALAATPTSAQVVDPCFPGVSAGVTHLARAGSTLYAAGGFWSAGPNSGGGVPVDLVSGAVVKPYAKVAGTVYACVGDGHDGWFIGGDFNGVGGQPRGNLAHILAGGVVDGWRADTDGEVNALLLDGDVLYVGGEFTHVAADAHGYLAAVSVESARPLYLNAGIGGVGADHTSVQALALRDGLLYVGGDFARVGGVARRNLAAVELATGHPTGLAVDPDDVVYALAVSDTALYVGGAFWTIGGLSRYRLAAVRRGSGVVLDFDPHITAPYSEYYDRHPYISAIVLDDTLAFIVGHFTRVRNDVRGGVAAIGLSSGRATAWNPHPINDRQFSYAPFIDALQLRDGVAFVGGDFDTLGGKQRIGVAAVSMQTGAATDWAPSVDYPVYAIGLSDSGAYIGGPFALFGDWEQRRGLAAFDLAASALLPWQPSCSGGIWTMVADSSAVYIGGSFSTVNGVPRSNLAALDPVTGATLAWNPGVNGWVTALALTGDRLLVGGDFTSLGGAPRWCVGSVDKRTGVVDGWAPDADAGPIRMVPAGGVVYVSGPFTSIGGEIRNQCAAIDLATGRATEWNPNPNDFVESVAVGPDAVYLGGPFTSVGGAPRQTLSAVDKVTGAVLDWNPGAERWPGYGGGRVYDLLVRDSTVYAAGAFVTIGGAERHVVAALSPTTGLTRPWDAEIVGDAATSLETWGDRLYVGGVFTRMGALPVSGIGACSLVPPAPPLPAVLTLGRCVPNPTSASAVVSFALPAAMKVTLEAFDISGRRVAGVLNDEERPAGWNAARLNVRDWRAGCYVYRLEAGNRTVVGKLVVVR